MKRIFKGPWLWIVLAVVGVLLALQYLAPNGGYDEVTTSEMESYIAKGEVEFETSSSAALGTLRRAVLADEGLDLVSHGHA